MGNRGGGRGGGLVTWKGRIFLVTRSYATASQSRTTLEQPSLSSLGTSAARSGYLDVLFSLLRLQHHHHITSHRITGSPKGTWQKLIAYGLVKVMHEEKKKYVRDRQSDWVIVKAPGANHPRLQ